MKLLRNYNQHRRDCWIDAECEGCGEVRENIEAYDDDNYWVNVLPDMECKNCGESTNSMGLESKKVRTKYRDWEQV